LVIRLIIGAAFRQRDDVVTDRGNRGATLRQAHHTERLPVEELLPQPLQRAASDAGCLVRLAPP
jgi:hypothetical protein